MSTIKKFNEFQPTNEEVVYQPNSSPVNSNPPSEIDEESYTEDGTPNIKIEVTVKDLIDFLSTLPPDTVTFLDHDGWDYESGLNGSEIVKNSSLFWYNAKDKYLAINN